MRIPEKKLEIEKTLSGDLEYGRKSQNDFNYSAGPWI
jgi:hypothetical protein